MKITFSKLLIMGGVLMSLYSCREDLIQQDLAESQIIGKANAKNGRLYFPSKEALQNTYL